MDAAFDLSPLWEAGARGWVTDKDDRRAHPILNAPARGEPEDCFFRGGWRCAGAIWKQGAAPLGSPENVDHLVTIPFYIADGDPRHNVYCETCALAMGAPRGVS